MVTLAIALGMILVYAWRVADSVRADDVLFLANASLLAEPWRIFTSTFIHRLAPHFTFNLITLLWFGRVVERRCGAAVFSLTFYGALWTGYMSMLAAGRLPFRGISGGVCGLYGLLLAVDWKDNLYSSLKQRPEYWLYPLALVALFLADRLGLTPVANLNHVVAVLYGALIGVAVVSMRHRRLWFIGTAGVTIAITIVGAYIWERPWRHLSALTPLNCSVPLEPPGDVTTNPYVRMILSDESARPKQIYYIDAEGQTVLVSSNRRRSYRLLPYLGSAWRVVANDGRCRAQFVVTAPGIISLE